MTPQNTDKLEIVSDNKEVVCKHIQNLIFLKVSQDKKQIS